MKEKQKQTPDEIRRAGDKLETTLTEVSKPIQDPTSEAAQEAHEAALASHRTIKKDGMILSLNSHPDHKDEDELPPNAA